MFRDIVFQHNPKVLEKGKQRIKIPKFIDSLSIRKNAEILFGRSDIVEHVES